MDVNTKKEMVIEMIEKSYGGVRGWLRAEEGKESWVLLRSMDRRVDVGCIRINKRNDVTMYIDTKRNCRLDREINLPGVKIVSNPEVNFIKNKINIQDSELFQVLEVIRITVGGSMLFIGRKERKGFRLIEGGKQTEQREGKVS